MPKDFDFKRTPNKPEPSFTPAPRKQAVPAHHPASKKKGTLPMVLLVFGILIVIVAVVFLYYRDNPATAPAPSLPGVNQETMQTNAISEVSIYNGGAGQDACAELAQNMVMRGYKAECLGNSLDSYEQTVIWYTPETEQTARILNTQFSLSGSLQESRLISQQNILIFLGKN